MHTDNSPQTTDEQIADDLKREILYVRDAYRMSKVDAVRDSLLRYHTDLMRELRELTD